MDEAPGSLLKTTYTAVRVERTSALQRANDFLNWSIIDRAAFDYAANAWGYTHGVAAEWPVVSAYWWATGQLRHPGSERLVETYYGLSLTHGVRLSLDYQFILNPAYNRDGGPVSVFGVRFHAHI